MNIILGHMAFRKINTECLVAILVCVAGQSLRAWTESEAQITELKSERKTRGHLSDSLIQDEAR